MKTKITVRELYELTDKTTDGWNLYIWNMAGSIKHGVINSFYGIDSLAEDLQSIEVKKIKMGYGTLNVFVDIQGSEVARDGTNS